MTLQKGKGAGVSDSGSNNRWRKQTMDIVHKENEYIDFKREPLLHMKHSVHGPSIDLFEDQNNTQLGISGAFLSPTVIYPYVNGRINPAQAKTLPNSENFEDVDIKFADVNGDHNQDVIVLGGGYQ